MSTKVASAMACLLATGAPPPVVGFAPSVSPQRVAVSTSAPMSAIYASSSVHATEDMYNQLLDNASLCAHSDTCSIESADYYLSEIVHIQSGCAAGTFSGNDVCTDVVDVSKVVADLRQKIGEGAKRAAVKPEYLAFAAIAVVSMFQSAGTMDASVGGVVPFTAQEVWWAVRDGYVGDLSSHLFHNGGLVVGDPVCAVGSLLSPQELLWSIRDGYASDTLFSSSGGGVESVPFTPQETWWAIKNGYGYDMAEHWFRNGGLTV